MSNFIVRTGILPPAVSAFKNSPLKPGTPALVIKHPTGAWSFARYSHIGSITTRHLPEIGNYIIGKTNILLAETDVHGSTQHADGTKEAWIRPGVAYAGDSPIETVWMNNNTLYIYEVEGSRA